MTKDYKILLKYAEQRNQYFNGHKENYEKVLELLKQTKFRDGRLVYTYKNCWEFDFFADEFNGELLLQIKVRRTSKKGLPFIKKYLKFNIKPNFRFDSELKNEDNGW